MFIRQNDDGNWYVYKQTKKPDLRFKISQNNINISCILIPSYQQIAGHTEIKVGHLIFPNKFSGKKIRLKVEFLDNFTKSSADDFPYQESLKMVSRNPQTNNK